MRDDLHKKAPVPPRVQWLLKLALREADRLQPDRLAAAAQSALKQAVNQGCSEDTLDRVAGRRDQGELFGPVLGRPALSPLEGEILSNLDYHSHDAQPDALRSGLAFFAESWTREIRATLVSEGPIYDLKDVMSALQNAFDAATHELTRAICANESMTPSAARVELNDNLLPPGWSAYR